NCALLIVAWLGTLPCHRLPLHCSWIARRIRLRPGSVVVAWPVAILVVVSAIIPAIVIGTAAVVPVAVIAARTYGVHLNEISVIVHVNVVAHTPFAGIEAVGQARSFEAHVVIAAPLQGLLRLVNGVNLLHNRS